MLGRNPTGPPAGQVALEQFGLAGVAEAIAQALADQGIEPLDPFDIFALPRNLIAPSIGAEHDDHG